MSEYKKRYNWKKLSDAPAKEKCHRRGWRTRTLKGGKLLRVCCPTRRWNDKTKRCKGGMKGYEVGTLKKGARAR